MRLQEEADDDVVVVCQLPQVTPVDLPRTEIVDETAQITAIKVWTASCGRHRHVS